ncbi:Condensin-2 complex subunit G2 [Melipona quadrifasciata]|uniref:Condensin-2 complex subunit G2 n=1 Tax=Melipona quadrifasciata TaxID=166423 RepID=A0A0N0U5V8_9HYME|nr:Condensin-2 complex subunit G2 [Melipona quadrifasciata]
MSQQRGLSRDRVLFRILKTKSSAVSSICEKLDNNVKNVVLLSEDELCELWQHVKTILLKAQKLYKQAANDKYKYTKEFNLMVKLIRTITLMALETIVQRIFKPNILLQNIMLLHSAILPNIKDEQQHIKRLYEIRSAIMLLKCTEDVRELLKLVREKSVMSLEEGRMLILHLFTLGEQYILGIHNNVKVVLQNIERNYIAAYADLYVTAWLNATEKFKKFIVENCLQNIIFHCFQARRDSAGRGKLGQNLLLFLAAMHDNKKRASRLMIHNECKSLVWKYLKVPGSFIKCNAIEILFVTSSVQYTCVSKDKNKIYIQKYYGTITDLLKNSNPEVCIVTINGLFEMLEKYWSHVPINIIQNWLNILLDHTKNANNSEIRACIFIGLKKILVKERSHRIVKDFLPNFAHSIYDEDQMVLEALIKLLYHAQKQLGILFWNIVPLTYVLDRLETTQNAFVLQELIKLVWLRISSNGTHYDKIKDELAYIATSNINAIRRFCLHSKFIISWNTSTKLIETLLSMTKEEIECLPPAKVLSKNCNKRAKIINKESRHENESSVSCNKDFDNYRNINIYIDVIAMLLKANIKDIDEEKFYNEEMNILQVIAYALPELFKYFRETPVKDSIIFLFSLIPPKFFLNKIEVIEMLVQQLCDPNTSDETLLSIVYLLMKWNKEDTILFTLTHLFTESLNTNAKHNQNTVNCTNDFQINEKGLELSLRILKHLLHIEYQSDVFDASEHFSEVLLWIRRTIVPHMSHVDVNIIENHHICIKIIKSTFDVSNLLMKEYNATPKLCCDIVLLYCSCLSSSNGFIFLNEIFDAIMLLLDFSKMAYDKKDKNLLKTIVPNFICITMIDMLSALIIIYKMLKLNDKKVTNLLKNVTLASKVDYQKQPCDTPFDRYY